MIARVPSGSLGPTSVYFPGLHPSIYGFTGLTRRELDVELKLAAFCNGTIVVGGSHLTNPNALRYFREHPDVLRKGVVVPYLGSDFESFDSYFERRNTELFSDLSRELGSLGVRYDRSAHQQRYFGGSDPRIISDFLDDNVRRVVTFESKPARSMFDFVVNEELHELGAIEPKSSESLSKLCSAVTSLGEHGDPLVIADIIAAADSAFSPLVLERARVVLHRAYGVGGMTQLGRGLLSHSRYSESIREAIVGAWQVDDISTDIMREVIRGEFDPLDLHALEWSEVFEIIRQERTTGRLQRAINQIHREARESVRDTSIREGETRFRDLQAAVTGKVAEKWSRERRLTSVDRSARFLDRNWRLWTMTVAGAGAIAAASGQAPAATASFGLVAGPYALKEAWKRWGPSEFSVFTTRLKAKL